MTSKKKIQNKKINMVILLDLSPHLNPKYKLKITKKKFKKKNQKSTRKPHTMIIL